MYPSRLSRSSYERGGKVRTHGGSAACHPCTRTSICARRFCRRSIVRRLRSPVWSAYRVRRFMASFEEKQLVTPAMALRLGKSCGNGLDLWLNLQRRYDLRHARAGASERRSRPFRHWKWRDPQLSQERRSVPGELFAEAEGRHPASRTHDRGRRTPPLTEAIQPAFSRNSSSRRLSSDRGCTEFRSPRSG